MDAAWGREAPGSSSRDGTTDESPDDSTDASPDPGNDGDSDAGDASTVVAVLHRVGRCPLQGLLTQPELHEWSAVRLERAVVRAWNGGLVFIDRNDDLVAL